MAELVDKRTLPIEVLRDGVIVKHVAIVYTSELGSLTTTIYAVHLHR